MLCRAVKQRGHLTEGWGTGVLSQISVECLCRVPVGFSEIAVHDAAKPRHAVASADFPASTGLFQAATDQILAATLDLATPDQPDFRKTSSAVRQCGSATGKHGDVCVQNAEPPTPLMSTAFAESVFVPESA